MMEQIESKRSKLPKTDIVCKFFLSSIKDKTYGYKWQCPNGDECHYKHCLPKDFIIKKMQGIGAQEEMTFEEFHDLEEKIDMERERVSLNGTKVTEKTLAIWLEKRKKEKMSDIGQKKRDEMMKLKHIKLNLFCRDELFYFSLFAVGGIYLFRYIFITSLSLFLFHSMNILVILNFI